MSGAETRLLYFFSATAQTLGALLGIGIVSLTFYAQWLSKKRQELLNDLADIAASLMADVRFFKAKQIQYKNNITKMFNDVENQGRTLQTAMGDEQEVFINKKKEYNKLKIAIPFGCFVFCTIVCSATIIICLISILYVEDIFDWIWKYYFIKSVIILSVLSLGIYVYLAVKAVSSLRIVNTNKPVKKPQETEDHK